MDMLGGPVPLVFVTCGDSDLSETLRRSFTGQDDFNVYIEIRTGLDVVGKALELAPDLVIFVIALPRVSDFQFFDIFKLNMPTVPVFLVSDKHSMEAEKEALSHGIDAVFEKDQEFSSLVMNARSVCGLESLGRGTYDLRSSVIC